MRSAPGEPEAALEAAGWLDKAALNGEAERRYEEGHWVYSIK